MTDRRPGPLYSDFFRRLRARSLSSWAMGGRIAVAREACDLLADLGWAAEGRHEVPVPVVPDLGPHALADQIEVLTTDALVAGADPVAVRAVLSRLADGLSVRLD